MADSDHALNGEFTLIVCLSLALTVEKYKNLFLYSPALKEADCVRAESQSFLERFFGGDVRPLLIHFAENKQLTAEDLAELQKILRQNKK